jgi:hypothetical protein
MISMSAKISRFKRESDRCGVGQVQLETDLCVSKAKRQSWAFDRELSCRKKDAHLGERKPSIERAS